ncbi:hypothetical protein FB45DRAFT_896323 [Roridomyces roridus]|uniref:Uncharacterized protein n=1 Tax=Roridomyces roridus TaxID=1738132 RepID=A0AAD7FXP1_9AGAR|nr:hypothetical protein FB45DRAFT_896323 [Roridomyces roridus]
MSVAGHARYVHYNPPNAHAHTQIHHQPTTVSPQDTQHVPTLKPTPTVTHRAQPIASTSQAPQPVVAKGDWTKDLVQLAKTAELKKHALTLQLHTAHILSAHASLEQKNRAVQDILEQRNKLESERNRLIDCLSQVNEDRNQADLLLSSLQRECTSLQSKIATLSAGEYAVAKADVDKLRSDLGQLPLPGLQQTLEGRGVGYLDERRTAGPSNMHTIQPPPGATTVEKKRKRSTPNGANGAETGVASTHVNPGGTIMEGVVDGEGPAQAKRPRGRPRGSRNRGGAAGG